MKIFLYSLLITQTICLYFDLFTYKETCFSDEFLEGTVAIIQYKTMEFYEDIPQSDTGHFILNISAVDLELYKKENKNKLKKEERILNKISGTEYFIVPETNFYIICVKGNHRSFLFRQNKFVKFSINIDTNEKIVNLPIGDLPDNENFKLMDDSIQKINKKINEIIKEHKYEQEIEGQFSEYQENNNSLIFYLTLFECLLIILIFIYSYIKVKKAMKVDI